MRTLAVLLAAGSILAACAGELPVPVAAAPAATPPPACEVTVWLDQNFWSDSTTWTGDKDDVGQWWIDNISSVEIKAGVWEFFTEKGFGGDSVVIGPGRYGDIGPIWNDRIRSLRCLGDRGPALGGWPRPRGDR